MLAIAREGTQIGIGVDDAERPEVVAVVTQNGLAYLHLDPAMIRRYLIRGNDLAAIELSILISSVVSRALADTPHHAVLTEPPHQTLTARDEAVAVASMTGESKCPAPSNALRTQITAVFADHEQRTEPTTAPGIKPFVIAGHPRITITSVAVLKPSEHFSKTVMDAINTVINPYLSVINLEHPITSPSETSTTAAHTPQPQPHPNNADCAATTSAVITRMERPTP